MINIKPEIVWGHFEKISEIPRCSGNEEGVRNYILEEAEEADLETRVDEAGNVLLEGEGSPNVVLQAHMDMVCEKNSGVDHDFQKDSIRLKEEDGWITAEGTTLGADNGIGVAIALAAATGDYGTSSLDCLFTVDEERGLNGASSLDPTFIRGDRLINLDSEEFGVFTIGCAGGGKTTIDLLIDRVPSDSRNTVKVSVRGLIGGHSGADIDKGRANAIKLLTRALDSLEGNSLSLVEISGGDKHNAIPREASAVLLVETDYSVIKDLLEEQFSVFKAEYEETEPEMNLKVERLTGKNKDCFSEETTRTLIDLIQALPNGVMAYDKRLESTVETSTNLASIRLEDGTARLLMSSRSSRESKLENLRKNRIEAIGETFGGEVGHNEAYPAWQPDKESQLLEDSKQVFRDMYGESPEIKVVHGGLETGIIGEKKEGIEMIAIGPDIESPHSPEERLNIGSVEKFWNFLLGLLRDLSRKRQRD
ncbi:beta-Ala-His dipeptidase [Candidatus Bipolaricaulota bacterium]|nr:beta-Ala-His dipeptidase [Candidatus Bipolaricaulota bacterium]